MVVLASARVGKHTPSSSFAFHIAPPLSKSGADRAIPAGGWGEKPLANYCHQTILVAYASCRPPEAGGLLGPSGLRHLIGQQCADLTCSLPTAELPPLPPLPPLGRCQVATHSLPWSQVPLVDPRNVQFSDQFPVRSCHFVNLSICSAIPSLESSIPTVKDFERKMILNGLKVF